MNIGAWGDVAWGNVAEWVGALGAAGAFIAALGLLKAELKARREDVAERQALQARLVFVGRLEADGSHADTMTWAVTVQVRNDSDQAVYQLMARLEWVDPASTDRPTAVVARLHRLLPRSAEELEWPDHLDLPVSPGAVEDAVVCRISFTDAAGRRWYRRGDDLPCQENPTNPKDDEGGT